jgi:hypothetical protein
MERKLIQHHYELKVYRLAFEAAMRIFAVTAVGQTCAQRTLRWMDHCHLWFVDNAAKMAAPPGHRGTSENR